MKNFDARRDMELRLPDDIAAQFAAIVQQKFSGVFTVEIEPGADRSSCRCIVRLQENQDVLHYFALGGETIHLISAAYLVQSSKKQE